VRLLHVEDNPTDADLTRRLLARQAPDIALATAASLAAARECLLAEESYDLALVDLHLPDGSGLQLLTWIRERQLPLAVVMLTGAGDPEAAIAALQAGADDYLTKDLAAQERLTATLRAAWGTLQRRPGPARAAPAGALCRAPRRRSGSDPSAT
jgi:DNA-binding response OmpR family regulator